MLTQKQQELFKLLGVAPEREAEIRKLYGTTRVITGHRRPFTQWLEDRLRAKWRREHERTPYLGD